jgi:hypothetical protein
MKTCLILVALIASIFLSAAADAQLKWEQTEVELRPAAGDDTAVGHFRYENAGTKPIHINSVATSCGCTVASLKSNDVAPGEKGEITATFKIGDRTGTQRKMVTVMTNDPAQPRTVLTLKAVIPPLLEVQPVLVSWNQNEPLKPKVISLRAPQNSPVTNVSVKSSNPLIATTIEPGDQPKEWKLNVLPKDASQQHATLTIAANLPEKAPKLYYAGARVTNQLQQ